ncbi:WYL domain-containing protein [Faecalitalea cylindroides]|uniref:WYL domain-containing protein n=1 Tax=Faecalitalea cylindroides TaxID=39483 RepID=UPI0026762A07|nr:WYL domain-containing protein [Faecalitalea cylindroides]
MLSGDILKKNIKLVEETKKKIDCRLSYSSFFRRLFISYSSLPIDQRELIIFKPIADNLLKAIHSQKQIKITTAQKSHIVSPLALMATDTDPYNYLMCLFKQGKFFSSTYYRLANIKYIEILDKHNPLSKHQRVMAIKKSKEYITSENEFQKTFFKIHFTAIGMAILDDLDNIPEIVNEDKKNRIYTFYSTTRDCFRFLNNFEEEAIIIEPISLAISVHNKLCKIKLAEVNHQLREKKETPPVPLRFSDIIFAKFALSKNYLNKKSNKNTSDEQSNR